MGTESKSLTMTQEQMNELFMVVAGKMSGDWLTKWTKKACLSGSHTP